MRKKFIAISLAFLGLLTSCTPDYNLDFNYDKYVIEILDNSDNIFTSSSYFVISKENNTGRELHYYEYFANEEPAYFLFYNLKDDISYIDFSHIADKALDFNCMDENGIRKRYFTLCSEDWSKEALVYKSTTTFKKS